VGYSIDLRLRHGGIVENCLGLTLAAAVDTGGRKLSDKVVTELRQFGFIVRVRSRVCGIPERAKARGHRIINVICDRHGADKQPSRCLSHAC